jgi:hypothetical protein
MSENSAWGFNRRNFLKGTAAASLGTAAAAAGITPAGVQVPIAAAAEPAPMPPHGAELRGMDLVVQSPTAEGRFGFMFKSQPKQGASRTQLEELGLKMEEQPVVDSSGSTTANDANNENPNPALTSGFTFVGQFVDHDITFDTTPLDDQQSDPYATSNFRVPRYDLDSVYGRGPASSDSDLYDAGDPDRFQFVPIKYDQIGTDMLKETEYAYDVPRETDGTAKIADPRNDQTLIILQLHVAMQMFHNKLVDYMRKIGVPRASVFESARRTARWHYQWMVIHEFLPAIVGKTMADSVYKEVDKKAPIINIKYYKPATSSTRPFIPVEFAVAAYRFGHSITRPRYTVRDYVTSTGDVKEVKSVPLFGATATTNNLNGHRQLPPRLKIQWSKFFNAPNVPRTARPVRQFDTSLAAPLADLPATVQPDTESSSKLAQRNLLRGSKMGLPSGQQVARLMGVAPLTNDELAQNRQLVVKIPVDPSGTVLDNTVVDNDQLVPDADLATRLKAMGEAPLWFYILKEAEILGKGRELGPVGGRIVAEVLVGLLKRDINSYLSLQPTWKPGAPVSLVPGRCTMFDILKFAGLWS